MTPIVFPGLGFEVTIDPVAFTLFGKNIYWYGIIIAVGFLLALLFCYRQAPRLGLSGDSLTDMILYALPIGIIGARAYYVIFYMELYLNADGSFNWGKAVAIWDGGLAIYGGIIAAVITAAVFCRVKKIPFFPMADAASYGLLIGQLIGRWGNFVNQEAYGGPCTALWRMGLTVNGVYTEVHPTFLYESLWNLAGLCILYFIVRPRRKFDGQLFWSYILWYGLGRTWIEGMRTDSLYLFNTGIRVSQALALVSALAALTVILVSLHRQKTHPKPLYVNRTEEEKPSQTTDEAADESKQRETKEE
ncbi:MAG: prolipoprotein diacylglyceryl transferase [Clostridiales bacterium]|nr:prolipoprotein diacylglyceryl transferase [Clostridiales bacterium]